MIGRVRGKVARSPGAAARARQSGHQMAPKAPKT